MLFIEVNQVGVSFFGFSAELKLVADEDVGSAGIATFSHCYFFRSLENLTALLERDLSFHEVGIHCVDFSEEGNLVRTI